MTPAPPPVASLVVASWNRRAELEPLLESVAAQTIADRIEVIIVDNGSTDDTLDYLANRAPMNPRVFAYEHNTGASTARNAGIVRARAPYVFFADSDAILLSPDLMERCVEHLEHTPACDGVAPPIWMDRECTIPFNLHGMVTPDGDYNSPPSHARHGTIQFLSTCFCAYRMTTLREFRGFDPWYFYGVEDMDLGLRIWHERRRRDPNAHPLDMVEGVHVHHNMSTAGREIHWEHDAAQFEKYQRERLYLVLAYGGVAQALRVMARGPFRTRRMEIAWDFPLSPWQKLRAVTWHPLKRLLAMPWDLRSIRRDHLALCPEPRVVRDPVPE